MNHAFEFHLNQLLDAYDNEHRCLETAINTLPRSAALTEPTYYDAVYQLAHRQAQALADLIGDHDLPPVAEILHHHPLHSQVLLQSAFIRHAYLRPYGYPGDKDLMLMICQMPDAGATNYALLQNRVYLNLPAAAGVRQRVQQMAHYLAHWPAQSKILNLACGPALEVQACLAQQPERPLAIDLVDHDPHTILYTKTTISAPSVRHLIGNALHLAHGFHAVQLTKALDPAAPVTPPPTEETQLVNKSYDLVYTMGLYDYLAHRPGQHNAGTIGLTKLLFDLLKPGGTLLIGNFLAPSPTNAHTIPHQLMMELYANWRLNYRTAPEMMGFLAAVAPSRYTAQVTNEYFDAPPLLRGVIGFLVVQKQG